jgi:hypothetical protein
MGHAECMQLLLRYRAVADSVNKVRERKYHLCSSSLPCCLVLQAGETPIHIACKHIHAEAARVLHSCGALNAYALNKVGAFLLFAL